MKPELVVVRPDDIVITSEPTPEPTPEPVVVRPDDSTVGTTSKEQHNG